MHEIICSICGNDNNDAVESYHKCSKCQKWVCQLHTDKCLNCSNTYCKNCFESDKNCGQCPAKVDLFANY